MNTVNNSLLTPSAPRNYQVTVDPLQQIAVVTMFGVVHLKELVDSFSELVRHANFKINMPSCYDLSNASVDMDLNKTEIFYHFAVAMRERRGDSYRLAFVYGDPKTKLLGEHYQLFLARADVEVKMFNQFELAEIWLRQRRDTKH